MIQVTGRQGHSPPNGERLLLCCFFFFKINYFAFKEEKSSHLLHVKAFWQCAEKGKDELQPMYLNLDDSKEKAQLF